MRDTLVWTDRTSRANVIPENFDRYDCPVKSEGIRPCSVWRFGPPELARINISSAESAYTGLRKFDKDI